MALTAAIAATISLSGCGPEASMKVVTSVTAKGGKRHWVVLKGGTWACEPP